MAEETEEKLMSFADDTSMHGFFRHNLHNCRMYTVYTGRAWHTLSNKKLLRLNYIGFLTLTRPRTQPTLFHVGSSTLDQRSISDGQNCHITKLKLNRFYSKMKSWPSKLQLAWAASI